MKVNIGPYLNWWGPYQIADLLQKVGVSEDRCDKIGDWLAETWFATLCEWIHSKRKRKINVRIDRYDVWSADYTLALIILPLLKRYQQDLRGSPLSDDEDVPEHLRSTNAPPFSLEDGETDELVHDRWKWIVDEMIWAFEQIVDQDNDAQFFENGYDFEAHREHNKRIKRGTELFGKYFQALWT